MKFYSWLIALAFISFSLFSQTNKKFGRTYNDKLPANYVVKVSDLKNHINNGIPEKYNIPKYSRMNYRFADMNSFLISDLLSSGQVYTDWTEMETFLNKVLEKVMPEELKTDSMIRAYIVKDGNFNAYMTPGGMMFIHVGVFSHIYDESTLAAILAHELAHYYKRHSYKAFVESETNWSITLGGIFDYSHSIKKFSIDKELEADSLAMVWINRSEYHLSGVLKAFQIMQRLDRQLIRLLRDDWELKESTHPSSNDRLEKLNQYYEKNKAETGLNFIVNKDAFFSLKEEAKIEILKCLLNEFRYYDCMEEAFKFHIFDPENVTYIYYLLESIRRNCYLDDKLWEKNFITNRYYNEKSYDGQRDKVKMEDDIFVKFDLDVMALAPQEAKHIRAKFYWQDTTKKFATYEDAYEFFYQVGNLLKCNECIFSNALSQTKSQTNRDSLLNLYLSKEDILYRSYAQNLKEGSIIKNLARKKLMVFNSFTASIHQGTDEIPVRVESNNLHSDLLILFDSIKIKFPDRLPVYILDLKENGINDFLMFQELFEFSTFSIVTKGEKMELHILDPRFLDLFTRYNVNEIEFLNCRYGEYRQTENSADSYESVTNINYQDIFMQTKRTRYLEVYISCVREVEKGLMKFSHYGGQTKFKFNNSGFEEIVSEIKYQIYRKNDWGKKLDETLR